MVNINDASEEIAIVTINLLIKMTMILIIIMMMITQNIYIYYKLSSSLLIKLFIIGITT
jgi:hypothetical protein